MKEISKNDSMILQELTELRRKAYGRRKLSITDSGLFADSQYASKPYGTQDDYDSAFFVTGMDEVNSQDK